MDSRPLTAHDIGIIVPTLAAKKRGKDGAPGIDARR